MLNFIFYVTRVKYIARKALKIEFLKITLEYFLKEKKINLIAQFSFSFLHKRTGMMSNK